MNRYAALLVPAVIPLLIVGCTPRRDRARLLKDVETIAVRMENLHTRVPDLLIRVPTRFVVEWTSEARYDKYFIYDPKDTADVQKGMVMIDVAPFPARQIPDTSDVGRSIGTIDGHDVIWREYVVEDMEGPPLHQREMTSAEVFEEAERFVEEKRVLHAFVVGTDPELVELLTGAVETITVLPRKPNL